MIALHIGVLVIDGVTLAEVAPARERLEMLGARITLVVPTGGSIVPVSGQYFPGAGGHSTRRSISQVSPSDLDILLLPDSITAVRMVRREQLIDFLRQAEVGNALPVFRVSQFIALLEKGAAMESLQRAEKGQLAAAAQR